jgi:hypothetical protein
MLTIKNDSDIIFSSKKVDGSAYEINLKLKIAFFDDSGNQI